MSFSKKASRVLTGMLLLLVFGASFVSVSAATYKGKVVKSADGMVKGETKPECELIGGSENAKFAFFLARANTSGAASLLCGSFQNWSGSSADFNSATSSAASTALSLLGSRAQSFAIYRSNKIFKYDVSPICSEIENSKKYIYKNYGWVVNGAKIGAFAANGFGDEAYYCSLGSLSQRPTAFFHEQIGHGFARLMDEYDLSMGGASLVPVSNWPGYNCTKDSGCWKWKPAGSELDEGCFEGCYPYAGTRYRSSDKNIMRDDRASGAGPSKLHLYIIDELIKSDRNFSTENIADLKESL